MFTASYHPDDTIAAVATAAGGAARAVIRIAGPDTLACLERCFAVEQEAKAGTKSLRDATSARIVPGFVRLAESGRRLPCQLYLWPDARSYTRGPQAEIHTIGSPPLAAAVLRTLCNCGARLAQPGEFTLRAFLGGRLDLTQAEAVLGVIDADDKRELEIAVRQLAGGLSVPLSNLRDRLLELLAHLEAGLDFVDEDIEFISTDQLTAQLDAARQQVAEIVQQMQGRNETFDAVRIVLVGQPNMGKSSLFNALIDRPGAIVSESPGTTRDYLTARFELAGVRCELIDTAGTETAQDKVGVAAAAQAMTARQRQEAHLRLVCLDASRELRSEEQAELAAAVSDQFVVLTKCDLPRFTDLEGDAIPNDVSVLATSAKTGAGIDELRRTIGDWVQEARCSASEVVGATAVRCQESLRLAEQHLQAAYKTCEAVAGEELVAADLRAALDELGQVQGTVYTDDILERIFSRFCIGK